MQNRFGVLLGALIILLVSSPIVTGFGPGRLAGLLVLVFFSLTLLAAVFAVSRTRRTRLVAFSLAIPTLATQTLNIWMPSSAIALLTHLLGIVFLGFAVLMILKLIFTSKRITTDVIFAAICAYILLGVFWAIVYSGITVVTPASFAYPLMEHAATAKLRFGAENTSLAIYYSMVTMSTLGYGDIVPVLPFAQACATLQAIMGQLYLAVLVARLVGLQISQATLASGGGATGG